MKKSFFYTVVASMVMGVALCSCSKDDSNPSGTDDNGGKLPESNNLLDGAYSIKFLGDEEDVYTIFTSNGAKDRNERKLRMDQMFNSEYYEYSEGGEDGDGDGELIEYVFHSILIDCGITGLEYSNSDNEGNWEELPEEKNWAANSIKNELAGLTLDPKYYVEVGFEKKGKITILDKEVDLYVGTGDMVQDFHWVGYDNLLSRKDYKKMEFAYYGGIVLYVKYDDTVALKAVAYTKDVPDKAFTKQVDVNWFK